MLLLRSTLFFVWFALATFVLCLLGVPTLVLDRRWIVRISRTWSRATLWSLKRMAGLDYEVRGPVPSRGVLIASKHMSMWDTIALYLILDDPTVILKRELLRVPFYGWFVRKTGAIAVDREGRTRALRDMVENAQRALGDGHAILIFPEGHRMAPGAPPQYKPGVAALYTRLNVPCAPVALNSGLFWTGPLGFLKKPGRIVVDFLDVIPAGLGSRDFLRLLEERIETATSRLLDEGRDILAQHGLEHAARQHA